MAIPGKRRRKGTMNNTCDSSNLSKTIKRPHARCRLGRAAILCAATFASLQAHAADSKAKSGFMEGPGKARLEKVAELDVPEGYIFVDGKTTHALMNKPSEPTSGNEYGWLMSSNETL